MKSLVHAEQSLCHSERATRTAVSGNLLHGRAAVSRAEVARKLAVSLALSLVRAAEFSQCLNKSATRTAVSGRHLHGVAAAGHVLEAHKLVQLVAQGVAFATKHSQCLSKTATQTAVSGNLLHGPAAVSRAEVASKPAPSLALSLVCAEFHQRLNKTATHTTVSGRHLGAPAVKSVEVACKKQQQAVPFLVCVLERCHHTNREIAILRPVAVGLWARTFATTQSAVAVNQY